MQYEESVLGPGEGSVGCWPLSGEPHYLECYYPLESCSCWIVDGIQSRSEAQLFNLLGHVSLNF